MKRALGMALAPILAAATLTACGSDDDHSGGSTSGHSTSARSTPSTGQNEQDVTFAQQMIPHHRQAIDMAGLASTRATSAEVKRLATQIEKAQDPEIQKMTGWLKSWGKPPAPSDMGGAHHGGGADGMMSEQDMKRLETLSGAAFDKTFLEMMIKHHQGAVDMAEKERSEGRFPDATSMAGDIITSQTTEIATMRKLLAKM